LGGIAIWLVDEAGEAVSDRHVVVTMDGEKLHEGVLAEDGFSTEDRGQARFTLEIDNGAEPLTLEIPWQRAPLVEQVIPLPPQPEEQTDA